MRRRGAVCFVGAPLRCAPASPSSRLLASGPAALEAGASLTFFVLPDTTAEGRTLADLGLADDHVAVPAMMRGGAPYSPAPTDAPLEAGDTLFLVGESEDLMRVVGRLEGRAG